ncbi:hypothetical protein QFC21_001553 [Naganishia friedmannii]|uniref:Uncharacterized protein n=1 Tax=Naganishia friedmannii TaxID=89922 RepID=A0ACC2W5N4_9TREE|nr:hypothetical protein QFC21_001553 [Naganishia friedmannii]
MDYYSLIIPPTRTAKRSFTSSSNDGDIDTSQAASSSSPIRTFKKRKLAKYEKTETEKDVDEDVQLMGSEIEEASTPDEDGQSITNEIPDSARIDRLVSSMDTDHAQMLSVSSPLRLPVHLSKIEAETQTFNLRGRTAAAVALSLTFDSFSLVRSGIPMMASHPGQEEASLQSLESSDDTLVGGTFDDGNSTISGAAPIECLEVPGTTFASRPYIYQTPTRQGVVATTANLQALSGISPPSPSQFPVAGQGGSFHQVVPQVRNVGSTMLLGLGSPSFDNPTSSVGIAIDVSPTAQRQRPLLHRNHRVNRPESLNSWTTRRQLENDENQPIASDAELSWDFERVAVDVASPLAMRHELQYAESIAHLQRSPRNLTTGRSLHHELPFSSSSSLDASPTRAHSLRADFSNYNMRNVSQSRGNSNVERYERPRSIRTEGPSMANRIFGAWPTLQDITVRGGSYRSPVSRTNSMETPFSASYRNNSGSESHAYGYTTSTGCGVKDEDRPDIIMESSSPVGSPSVLPCGDTLIQNMTGCQLDDEMDPSEVLHEVEDVRSEEYRGFVSRSEEGRPGTSFMFQPYATPLRHDADCASI